MAWNKICSDIVHETIELQDPPAYVKLLNNNISEQIYLNNNEYVAQAGFIRDGIVDKINDELIAKFGKNALQLKSDLPPEGILAYAYLAKTFEFKLAFDNIAEPLKFTSSNNKSSNLDSFGLIKLSSNDSKEIKQRKNKNKQASACYFDKKQGFIIKLHSGYSDIITISTLPPLETLDKTFQQINSLCKNIYARDFETGDTLQIPKIDFKTSHSFDELLNKDFLNKRLSSDFCPYSIIKAIQTINFSLNEKGVKLESMAEIDAKKGIGDPIEPQDFIVNGPFVIYLRTFKQEVNDEGKPYFMMYVDNDDLLVKK